MKAYLYNVWLGASRLLNAILGGDSKECLSSRMGREIAAGRCSLCKPACWFLGLFQSDHCAKAAHLKDK